uniref:Uncharacterized protein n=2 Tax=Canis lupus familiaris TaxID=9615 RepID=A0A8C0SP72_CANLF
MTPQNSTQSYSVNKSSRASQKMTRKMVGHVSFLAGCSTVNYHGDVLYDEYILPPCYIVDYWTRWSSIWKHHMLNATPFKIAQTPGPRSPKRLAAVGTLVMWGGRGSTAPRRNRAVDQLDSSTSSTSLQA